MKVVMLLLLAATAALAACGSTESQAGLSTAQEPAAEQKEDVSPPPEQYIGDVALWYLGDAELSLDSGSFTALVERVGCAGGETGEVLDPEISTSEEEILVTFTVEALEGPQPCPGNNRVPYEVVLPEPLGDRALIDGTCRAKDLMPGDCTLDGLRWTPERGVISEEADE